jgi:hypothetical protein
VYNRGTRKLELFEIESGEMVSSRKVREGNAKEKGRAGPLGRRFETEVELISPDGAWPTAFLAHSQLEAHLWVTAFNGKNPNEARAAFESGVEAARDAKLEAKSARSKRGADARSSSEPSDTGRALWEAELAERAENRERWTEGRIEVRSGMLHRQHASVLELAQC